MEDHWWITGGLISGSSQSTSSTELFNTGNETFSYYINLPVARNQHNLVSYSSNEVMMLGGEIDITDTYIFNINDETWSDGPSVQTARDTAQAGVITFANGTKAVMVAGGDSTEKSEILDLESMTWHYGPDLEYPIYYGASVQWQNTFLIVGGENYGGYLDTIWKFDVDNDRWVLLNRTLTTGRCFSASILVPYSYCQTL